MSAYSPPVPVKVRTARKRHQCSDCEHPAEAADADLLDKIAPKEPADD